MIMKRATTLLALLAAIGTAAVLWQRLSMVKARHAVSASASNSEPTSATVSATNTDLEREAAALRAQTTDLAKLRNEVSQLRTRQGELAAVRAEHEQLRRAKEIGAPIPREVPPGFIPKEQLRNAGLETPEDAVQTFFWAMREGELAIMLQSLSPENEERKQTERMPPEKRAEFEQMFRAKESREKNPMNHFNDFGVRGKEVISDDAVVLHIGSSLSTNTATVKLERSGGEWRLRDLPR